MKFSVSNIALPAYEHVHFFSALEELGLSGLEIALSRRWPNWWHGLSGRAVESYRQEIEMANLNVVGLHSLFWGMPELGLFKDKEVRKETLAYMVHLSSVCRDLGGTTLIYGGGRKRGALSLEDAYDEAISFFGELCKLIEGHDTVYCFEPLGPNDSDFINAVADSIRIVEAVGSPSLRVQLDAKALVENKDDQPSVFKAAKPYLVHYHANEPGLGILGSSGSVDHKDLGGMLKAIGYKGYVSIEQRMINETNPLQSISESSKVLRNCYL